MAGASALAPIASAASEPSGASIVTSAAWPPSTSITVNRSSGAIASTVAPPGRTQYCSNDGSAARNPPTRSFDGPLPTAMR